MEVNNNQNDDLSLEGKLNQLDSIGFTKRRKNEKLLKRTAGNLEIVRNFLIAQDKLKGASKGWKCDKKIERQKK